MLYICLSPAIQVSNAYQICLSFKFVFLLWLSMLLFLFAHGLNAVYLKLSIIEILVINAYLVNQTFAKFRIIMSGNIEVNSEPKCNFCRSQSFWTCHCNLNSLIAHCFAKFLLFTTYLSVNKLSTVCLWGKCRSCEFLIDGDNLQIPRRSSF